MSNLTTAIIPVEGQPSEFLPILSEFNRMVDLEVLQQSGAICLHDFNIPHTAHGGVCHPVILNRQPI